MPIVLLIYFFNSFLLPHGLLYSAILTPVFLYWIWKSNVLQHLVLATIGIVIFDCFHLTMGSEIKSLLISSALLFTAITFAIATWKWFESKPDPTWVMSGLLKWNTLFIILAFAAIPFGIGRAMMWYEIPISPGIASFPRLKLFAYEAAYYAFLFTPIFLFYFWRIVLGLENRWLLFSVAIVIPFLLSLSFGVVGTIGLALIISIMIFWAQLQVKTSFRKTLLYGTSFLLVSVCILLIVYPQNPVFERLANIIQGQDTSARGRLFESFMFAYDLASSKSLWIGVGLGQIKVLGHDLIINFYQYEGDFAEIVRIPNAMGEMLATYGIIGVILKLGFELYLFFKHRLYLNYFNLSLFLFVFIYQFTGSYLVNTAELLLWMVAVFVRFPELDVEFHQSKRHEGRIR